MVYWSAFWAITTNTQESWGPNAEYPIDEMNQEFTDGSVGVKGWCGQSFGKLIRWSLRRMGGKDNKAFLTFYHILEYSQLTTLWKKNNSNVVIISSESESCSVISDSLRPHGYTVVEFSFSRGFSWPRDRTQVSCIAVGFFTSWATRKAQEYWSG